MTEKLEKMAAEITANRQEIIEKLVQYSLTDMLFFWSTEKRLPRGRKKSGSHCWTGQKKSFRLIL